MGFVKLDSGILDSTIWLDKPARDLFITALLMAVPAEIQEPAPQIAVRSLEPTGWVAPPGWYGFIHAAGIGIVRRAGLEDELGMAALDRLCSPEESSRSPEFEGRRLARVNGGFLVLNFIRYRDKDHTVALRMRRYRQKRRDGVTSRSNGVTGRSVTQAEAEAEAEAESPPSPSLSRNAEKPPEPEQRRPQDPRRPWLGPETRTLGSFRNPREDSLAKARVGKPPEPDGTGVASLSPEEILKLPGLKKMPVVGTSKPPKTPPKDSDL